MNIKKLALSAAAVAMAGGFALAPNAQAAQGECEEFQHVEGVVIVRGEQPGGGEGCLVAEADGLPVNPVDDGHIGVYETESGDPALYGSCDGRDEEGNLKSWDPTNPSNDTGDKCAPGPA